MAVSTYTVQQLKSDWENMMAGTSLNDIQNPNDIIFRAARSCLLDVDFMETKRITQISNGVFDFDTGAYNYALPADLKMNKIIDLRPQINRYTGDNFIQRFSKEFDLYKAISSLSIDNDTGLKYIRISASTTPPVVFNEFDAVTGSNGTNSADGSIITSLAADTIYKVSGSASLSFNITGAGTGYIQNSTLSSIDLSSNDWAGSALAFLWIYIPTSASSLTSVTLRWGSSSANYYSASATSNFWSQSFVTGWNLLSFSWPSSSTGTPDDSDLSYMRASLTWAGGLQNTFRIDKMFFALPVIYEIQYYSKYLFQSSSGTWQETVLTDNDYVNLDTDSYNILLYKCSQLGSAQLKDFENVKIFSALYTDEVNKYKDNYPSEKLRPVNIYYRNRYIRER